MNSFCIGVFSGAEVRCGEPHFLNYLSSVAPARKSAQIIYRQYPRDLSEPSMSAAVSSALSNNRQLAFINFEVKNLPRLAFFPREVPFDLSLKLFPREFRCFVHPGCTSDELSLSIPASWNSRACRAKVGLKERSGIR